tara:strand:+ start:162 stop:368 length:207 start_codon:yes stop_codon:yes gene_type:complete
MNAENKFLLEKIRIMAKQVENNLKKKEEEEEEKDEKKNKKLINKPAGERINRLNNSHISWRNSLRRPW